MHNSDNYDASRSVSSEQHLEPGQYVVRLRVSASRYPNYPTLSKVIKRNSKHKRSKLMRLGSNYDVAHAKGLGFAALRERHVQRERAMAEIKRNEKERKIKEKKANEKAEETGEEDEYQSSESDDEPDQWNAICVAGLKVYSHDPELELEVKHHPALDLKGDAASGRGFN